MLNIRETLVSQSGRIFSSNLDIQRDPALIRDDDGPITKK